MRTRVRLNRKKALRSKATTNVIGPLYEWKKVCPCRKKNLPLRHSCMNQARSEEEEKRQEKTEDRRLMERKATQQNKNLCDERQPLS